MDPLSTEVNIRFIKNLYGDSRRTKEGRPVTPIKWIKFNYQPILTFPYLKGVDKEDIYGRKREIEHVVG